MADQKSSQTGTAGTKKADASAKAPADATSDDAGQAELQAVADEAEEKGYYGTAIDPTPDENYTLAGVVAGAPTPETDADAKAAADEALGRQPQAEAPEQPAEGDS